MALLPHSGSEYESIYKYTVKIWRCKLLWIQIILNEFKMQGHKMCSTVQSFFPFLYIIDYILSCTDGLEKLYAVYLQILCNN